MANVAGMLGAGFAVANVNYGLCPDVRLSQIVAQVRSALWFLTNNAQRFCFSADNVHVAGHSAGGHLAAMMATDPAGPALRSALLLSGLFDLAPLAFLPVGRIIGISTTQTIAELSPLMKPPRSGIRLLSPSAAVKATNSNGNLPNWRGVGTWRPRS